MQKRRSAIDAKFCRYPFQQSSTPTETETPYNVWELIMGINHDKIKGPNQRNNKLSRLAHNGLPHMCCLVN
eukprot:657132-Amphidinium_carterae.2